MESMFQQFHRNQYMPKMWVVPAEIILQYIILLSLFIITPGQDIFQSSLSLGQGHGGPSGASVDYNTDLSYQLTLPDLRHAGNGPKPVDNRQMVDVPVYVLMPDMAEHTKTQNRPADGAFLNSLPGYSLVQLDVQDRDKPSSIKQPVEYEKPEPHSSGYLDNDQASYDPFGMLLEQRTHARQAPYSMGYNTQLFQPMLQEPIFPSYETYGQVPPQGILHSSEVHPINTHIYQQDTPTYGFAPPTQPQVNAGFYQTPQSSNQIQIYPQKAESTMASAPVSSSSTSYALYQTPADPVQQQYSSIANPNQHHISAGSSLPYHNSVQSYQQPNHQQPSFSQVHSSPTAHTTQKPKKKQNLHHFLGAILSMLKRHMPTPMAQPHSFPPLRSYPLPLHSRHRRPVVPNFYRKILPKKQRYRKRKRYSRGRSSRQRRSKRHYGRKSQERYQEERDDDDDNVSVLGEDVYGHDKDVFDLEIREDGPDYSVTQDADIYDSDYEEDY